MKGNRGYVEGVDYECERFENTDGSLWFLLSSAKKTYLCCKGPFFSTVERDLAVIGEVKRRERTYI